MGCMELSSSSCAVIGVPVDLRWVSQGIAGVPKGSQDICPVWWGMGHCFEDNSGELVIISHWFELHRAISHCCGDISVLLDLWGISGVLSVGPSSKSKLLSCLIGNKALLCMQFRGIGTHLTARGKFHGFSRVAAVSWGTFSSYRRGSH